MADIKDNTIRPNTHKKLIPVPKNLPFGPFALYPQAYKSLATITPRPIALAGIGK